MTTAREHAPTAEQARVTPRSFARLRLGLLLHSVSFPRMAEHPLRSLLTVMGIAIGVALSVAVQTVNTNVLRGVSATVEDIAGETDLQIAGGSSGFDESVLERVAALPGVARASLVVQQVTTLQGARGHGERLLLLGIDILGANDSGLSGPQQPGLEAIRNDPIPFLNGPDHVLLSRSVAARLGFGLKDRVSVATAAGKQELVIWGLLDEEGLGRAFGGAVGVMDYQALQALLGRGQNIDHIDVQLAPGSDRSQVTAQLQVLLGSGFTVDAPSSKGERIGQLLVGVQSALSMASLIALLVAAFLIHNTIAISVVQRRKELALLRALGTQRGDLLRLLTLEGAALGVVGALLGVGLGVLMSRGLLASTRAAVNELYLQVAASELSWDPRVLFGSAVAGIACASAAAAWAARSAGRIEPAEALRMANLMRAAPLRLRLERRDLVMLGVLACALLSIAIAARTGLFPLAVAASFGFLAVGLMFLPRAVQLGSRLPIPSWLAPLELQLAQANLPRDLGRTSSTTAALMLGIALATSFAIFAHSLTSSIRAWVEQTLQGDLFLTNAASITGMAMREVPMDDSLRAELQTLPQLEAARRLRVIALPFRNQPVKLVASDMDVFARYGVIRALEGSRDDAVRGWRDGAVSISENFATRFDVQRGDRIALSTRHGTRSFEVAAVIVDYTSETGSIAMGWETYVQAFGDSRVGTYALHLVPGADAQATRREIERRFGSTYDLFILSNREAREGVLDRVEQMFALLRLLESVALAVAMLGIVNALLANVLDRNRELGVLRALGMQRSGVRKLVLFEGVAIGVLGLVVGMGVGASLGYVQLGFVNVAMTGWRFPFQLPFAAALELAVLTLVGATLAAIYPARRAAITDVKGALEYE